MGQRENRVGAGKGAQVDKAVAGMSFAVLGGEEG
jgi:hypothetical protein